MKNYLIFFGKSQDFTFHSFDNTGIINDFNVVIKDFDLLESSYFTTDDITNKEILSKYNFVTKSGDKYSLIKLYSLAQAVDGNRIAGSTYGVALLSDNDILFSNKNISILKVAKENFAKLSLNGLKFNKSNFKDDVFNIWSAIVNSKDGNYLDSINLGSTLVITTNQKPQAYFVNSLYEDATYLDSEMSKTQKIYISSDIDHLKRANSKWGDAFTIFVKSSSGWEKYQRPSQSPTQQMTPKVSQSTQDNVSFSENEKGDISKLKIQLSDLQYENEQIVIDAKAKISDLKKRNSIFFYANIIQVLIIFLLIVLYLKKKPHNIEIVSPDDVTNLVEIDTKVNIDAGILFSDSTYYKNLRNIVHGNDLIVKESDTLSLLKIRKSMIESYKILNLDTSMLDIGIKKRFDAIAFSKSR